jgi:DNA polymerase III sliding clamp (beta) subunit (PCNA family)
MPITINRETLLREVNICRMCQNSASNELTLSAEGDMLTLYAGNLITYMTRIPCMMMGDDAFDCSLPCKQMHALISTMNASAITLRGDGAAHQLHVFAKTDDIHTIKVDLNTLAHVVDRPECVDTSEAFAAIDAKALRRAISIVASAASGDPRFPVIALDFTRGDGKVHVVATDGRQLKRVVVDADYSGSRLVLLPREAVPVFSRAIDGDGILRLACTDERNIFTLNERSLICAKPAFDFPMTYARILETENAKQVRVNADLLCGAFTRAMATIREDIVTACDVILLGTRMEITAHNQYGDYYECVPCESDHDSISFKVSAQYMRDVLSHAHGDVSLFLPAGNPFVMLHYHDYSAAVATMRG